MKEIFNDIKEYNRRKIELSSKKIHNCIARGEEPIIILIDIDDTINKSTQATERQIERINYKASQKFLMEYYNSHPFFADQENFKRRHRDLRNQILEDYGPYLDSIDYFDIHNEFNLYTNVKETLLELSKNRNENTFIFFVSHRNPEREARIKELVYYNYFMENGESFIDGIITTPVFAESYTLGIENRTFNSKFLLVLETLNLPPSCAKCFYLLDDSSSVRCDFKEHGGNVIPAYLEMGYIKDLEDDKDDRQRVIINWDPYWLPLVIQKINYERNMGVKETKNFKVKKKTF